MWHPKAAKALNPRAIPPLCSYFLGPYEAARLPARDKVMLGANDAVSVADKVTGEVRLVRGPTTFVPGWSHTCPVMLGVGVLVTHVSCDAGCGGAGHTRVL